MFGLTAVAKIFFGGFVMAASPVPFKILFVGQGLYNPRLPTDRQITSFLQAEVANQFVGGRPVEIIPSTPAFESVSVLAKDIKPVIDAKPDMIILYSSGRTLPRDMAESANMIPDEDMREIQTFEPSRESLSLVEQAATWAGIEPKDVLTLRSYSALFPTRSATRENIIRATYRLKSIMGIFKSKVFRELHIMTPTLFASHPMDSSQTLDDGSFWRHLAVRFLTPHFEFWPEAVWAAMGSSFGFQIPTGRPMKSIYDEPYLDRPSAYLMNENGAKNWAAAVRFSVLTAIARPDFTRVGLASDSRKDASESQKAPPAKKKTTMKK